MHLVWDLVREGPGAMVGAIIGLAIGAWLLVTIGAPGGCGAYNIHLASADTLSYTCRVGATPFFLSPHLVSMWPVYIAGVLGGIVGHVVYQRGWGQA